MVGCHRRSGTPSSYFFFFESTHDQYQRHTSHAGLRTILSTHNLVSMPFSDKIAVMSGLTAAYRLVESAFFEMSVTIAARLV